jgi:DNA polymerase-3 subunit epsilon
MVRQIVIDTETTGLDPYKGNHRIIEIALIEVIDNVITGKKFHSYFDPQGRGMTWSSKFSHPS